LAAAGKFRADLLDRLAFDVVQLPTLQLHQQDIMLLAEHFFSHIYRKQ
jgi:psp operon transcriptional activator